MSYSRALSYCSRFAMQACMYSERDAFVETGNMCGLSPSHLHWRKSPMQVGWEKLGKIVFVPVCVVYRFTYASLVEAWLIIIKLVVCTLHHKHGYWGLLKC